MIIFFLPLRSLFLVPTAQSIFIFGILLLHSYVPFRLSKPLDPACPEQGRALSEARRSIVQGGLILNTGSVTATLPCLAEGTTSLRALWVYPTLEFSNRNNLS